MVQPTGLEPVTSSFAGRRSNPTELRLQKNILFFLIKFIYETIKQKMERGIGFEPTHPRVEALVHSLSYVTPAKW